MKRVRMNNKNLVEYLIGKLVVFILEVVVGITLVLGLLWSVEFMLAHTWILILMTVVAIISIFRMVADSE